MTHVETEVHRFEVQLEDLNTEKIYTIAFDLKIQVIRDLVRLRLTKVK